MRGLWFEEYERLWNEQEGEPSPEEVEAAVIDRYSAEYDRVKQELKDRGQ